MYASTRLPLNPLLHPLLDRALELAAQWHEGTYRKLAWRPFPFAEASGVPVIAHTVMVGLLLQRAGWDETTVAAGFLHDILEDSNRAGRRMTYEELQAIMGKEVAQLVHWVSEPRPSSPETPLAPWKERKQAYLRKLQQAPDAAIAISLADKLHNLWTMVQALQAGHDLFGKKRVFSAGIEAQQWFFEAVLQVAYTRTESRLIPLRQELEHVLEEFKTLTS